MPIYHERYRPQFHFTAARNWLNDPNGCVYFDGEYHLCYQHNPTGPDWESNGVMYWGHAVSRDLLHWQELEPAIAPYDGGNIWSGSAVVDWHNTSGLGHDGEPPLVAAFSHARVPFGQAIASSTDCGRTWQLFEGGRHVVPNQGLDGWERDPRVLWHAPTQMWIMVLWVCADTARFFTSPNLRDWSHASDFVGAGFHECPDLFELPVDGDPRNTRWVLHDGAFSYWLGSFDGRAFTAGEGPHQGDSGPNFYAAQTWSNTGDRRLQIAWLRLSRHPGMPFNQQMTIPCELTLRTLPAGIRICREPVAAIEGLRGRALLIESCRVESGEALRELEGFENDTLDLTFAFAPSPGAAFTLRVHGFPLTYANEAVTFHECSAPLPASDGMVELRILVDRASVEIFGNRGELSMAFSSVPVEGTTALSLQVTQGEVEFQAVRAYTLRSVWP